MYQMTDKRKTVFCAITGIPNVGKSTLINRLVGAKIAITAPKPQTTRTRIMGVITLDNIQYVFSDTPGMHKPHTKLGEYMQREIFEAIDGKDLVLFTIYPKYSLNDEEREMLERIAAERTPVVLVMNKADILGSRTQGLRMMENLRKEYNFSDTLAVSAVTGEGIDALMKTVAGYAKEGDFLYDEDTLTDQPVKILAAEIIREQLIMNLSDELPYGTAVTVDSFQPRADKEITDIQVTIICEKQSQKGIIIGRGGAMLKRIVSAARAEIEQLLETQVNLKCWVKVRDDWRDNGQYIREYNFLSR